MEDIQIWSIDGTQASHMEPSNQMQSEGETTPSEQVEAESEDCGSEDDAWITEAINKVCAEVDTSLDPAIAAMQWATLRKVEWE